MAGKPEKPTESLTIYLAKAQYKTVEALLKPRPSCNKFDISTPGGSAGTLYVQSSSPKPPRWARFFSGVVDGSQLGSVTSSAALLVMPVEGRLLAVTFGHGRHLLSPDCWEPRFGLRVALNSIDENKLRSIDKHTSDAIARNSKEQASREASAREFGIDVEQDLLRAVTGVPRDGALGKRMSGMDALNVAVPITLNNLPDLLSRYLEKSGETYYRKSFSWVDQIGEITDGSLIEKLDEQVVTKIRSGDLVRVWMAVPEIVPWERVAGFRFGLRKSCPEHHDIHLKTFIEEIGGAHEVSTERLKASQVHCMDNDGLPLESWLAYRCLYCELDYGQDSFVLSGGKWYQVTKDFVNAVNKAYSRIPFSPHNLPEYQDASETAYNRRVAAEDPEQYVLMDQESISYGGGHSSVEFCDLFTRQKDIVHVKRYGNSSVLSHLFSQGLVSGELFQTDLEFRCQVNQKFPRSHRLRDPSSRPRRDEFRVVFAVITEAAGDLVLPFFSRLNIKHAARRLEGYGYQVAKLKIPVAERLRKLKKYR